MISGDIIIVGNGQITVLRLSDGHLWFVELNDPASDALSLGYQPIVGLWCSNVGAATMAENRIGKYRLSAVAVCQLSRSWIACIRGDDGLRFCVLANFCRTIFTGLTVMWGGIGGFQLNCWFGFCPAARHNEPLPTLHTEHGSIDAFAITVGAQWVWRQRTWLAWVGPLR